MEIVKRKLFLAWNFGAEEKWLNKMSQDGYKLVRVSLFKYVFVKCEDKKYEYRLELLENKSTSSKGRGYIEFLEETGIEYVGTVNGWGFFRKESDTEHFELYSENDSKIKHLNRIRSILIPVIVINVGAATINIASYLQSEFVINLVCGVVSSLAALFLSIGTILISNEINKLKDFNNKNQK